MSMYRTVVVVVVFKGKASFFISANALFLSQASPMSGTRLTSKMLAHPNISWDHIKKTVRTPFKHYGKLREHTHTQCGAPKIAFSWFITRISLGLSW